MTDVRRGFTLLTLFAALALALLVVSAVPQLAPVEGAVLSVVGPVQRVLEPVSSGVRGVFQGVFQRDLRAENEALRTELARLRTENVRLRQLQYENDQLRQQLGFTRANPALKVLDARVIGRDPSSLRQYLVLDRGTADGVAPGMAVAHPGGALIGQVWSADERRCEVLLITDVESSVNAKVERTRADGIVQGRWQQGSFLRMRYIEQGLTAERTPRVQKGDWVLTSSLGGNMPDGMLIGQVQSVQQTDTGLEQEAEVIPAADIRSVETALIVLKP
ncbi:MAG: rod shape-determining protein MreC [Chloroflexota bacterium]|nr:rod shape-determining protein MreC [Chloroflexota bacterium]